MMLNLHVQCTEVVSFTQDDISKEEMKFPPFVF